MHKILLLLASFIVGCTFSFAQTQQHNVVLTWQDGDAGVTFSVYRDPLACLTSLTSGFTAISTSVTALTYTDTAVTVGSIYCYYVVATIDGLTSLPSNTVQVQIPPFTPVLTGKAQ